MNRRFLTDRAEMAAYGLVGFVSRAAMSDCAKLVKVSNKAGKERLGYR